MVLTMKDLKLLLRFFSFNESEKSGVEGDKRKEKEIDKGTEKGFMFTKKICLKNKILEMWISYEKKKKKHFPFKVSRTVKIYEAR